MKRLIVLAVLVAAVFALAPNANAAWRGCVIGPNHQRIGVNCPHRPTSGTSSIGPVYRSALAPLWVRQLWASL